MKRIAAITILLLLGSATAVAVADTVTTGTVVACATATAPTHTVAVDGANVSTVGGDTASQCATTTYTVPTVTNTVTNTVTDTVTVPPTTGGTTTAPVTTASTTTTASPGWVNVLDDEFNTGGVPSHWTLYSHPYGSNPKNCTSPTHDYVSGGYLNLLESYESATPAGVSCPYSAGWYTGGMKLNPTTPYTLNNQRVTVRYRIVSTGGITSHNIIPMLWPSGITYVYQKNNGESDFLESDSLSSERTFLHYVDSTGAGQQIASPLLNVDLTQWHTVVAQILNNVVTLSVDGTVIWTYTGNSTSVPNVLRTVVLQQECNHSLGCPTGTTGNEDIQIDWITVDAWQ